MGCSDLPFVAVTEGVFDSVHKLARWLEESWWAGFGAFKGLKARGFAARGIRQFF